MLGQVRLYGQRFIQYASPYDLQEVGIFFRLEFPAENHGPGDLGLKMIANNSLDDFKLFRSTIFQNYFVYLFID